MQVNIVIAAVIVCIALVFQASTYQHRIELIEVKAKLETKHSDSIKSYNRCLTTSIDMMDVKGCTAVHGQ